MIVEEIYQDSKSARILYDSQDNGKISQTYDKLKNNWKWELGSNNVEEAINLQEIGVQNLMLAKEGEISKREYYLQNKDNLVKMLIRRLYVNNKTTGVSVLDNFHSKNVSKEQFAQIVAINPRVTALIARVSSIKECS